MKPIMRSMVIAAAMAAVACSTAQATPPPAWIHVTTVTTQPTAVTFTLTRARGWAFAGYPRGCRIAVSYSGSAGARTFVEVYWPTTRVTRTTMGMPGDYTGAVTRVSASCGLRHLTRRGRWLRVARTATAP